MAIDRNGGGSPSLSSQDMDKIVRMVNAEAGNEGAKGMQAVAEVIRNRMAHGGFGGHSAHGVLTSPMQFEPVRAGTWMKDMPPEKYEEIQNIVNGVFSGQLPDVTNGATHFANMNIQAQRGHIPQWTQNMAGSRQDIGNHSFFGNYNGGGQQQPQNSGGLFASLDGFGDAARGLFASGARSDNDNARGGDPEGHRAPRAAAHAAAKREAGHRHG